MHTLLHLTDIHFGTAVPEQSNALLSTAKELNPDFTLISGDFSMRARKKEMIAARAWLDQLTTPQLTIPGNHDTPLVNNLIHRFFRPFHRYKKYINEDLEPTVELPVGRLIGINSSTPFGLHIDWSRGFLNSDQRKKIETGFNDLKDPEALRLVTFHHPIHRPEGSKRILCSPTSLIKQSLASASTDLLLAGHFHQSHAGILELDHQDKNIVISQASTACSHRTKGEPAGFHLIHLEKNHITIDQFTWQKGNYQKTKTSPFKKQNQRWQEAQ